nr:MAG TPA: hypothetical protein [Caudoviricetes sp.]
MRERPARAPKLRRHERPGPPGQIKRIICHSGVECLRYGSNARATGFMVVCHCLEIGCVWLGHLFDRLKTSMI